MHVVCANTFGAIVLKPRFKIDAVIMITVGAQSIARRHSTYVIMPKPKFRKFLFGKIKKEEFARRFFKKNSVFSRFKLLNKHFSKMTFYF